MKRILSSALAFVLCSAVLLGVFPTPYASAASKADTYKQTVSTHFDESFEISSYYENLTSDTRYLYKQWADNIDSKNSFTKSYLWCVQYMMGKNLDTNAYVDYLTNLLSMMEKGFVETTAAQASYNAKLSAYDTASDVLNIAFSDLLGGKFKNLSYAYKLISGGADVVKLGSEAITDVHKLSVMSAATVIYEQKTTVLQAIYDNTSNSYLKEAAQDLIHVCDSQYIYIFQNYANDIASKVATFDYDLLKLDTFEQVLPHINSALTSKFVPWLKAKLGSGAASGATKLLSFAGTVVSKMSYFTLGFSIGKTISKVVFGNDSENYREMLAMDEISDALTKAMKNAKAKAEKSTGDERYNNIAEFTAVGKMLVYTHMRGDYCNIAVRDGDKKEGSEQYLNILAQDLNYFEKTLTFIFTPDDNFVVNNKYPLYDGFIKKITPKTTVPEGYVGIYSVSDFLKISEHNSNDRNVLNEYNTAKYILMNNISMPTEYETINAFTGVIDGNGYTISNISEPLIGILSGATVKNLGLSISLSKDFADEQMNYGGLAILGAGTVYGNSLREKSTIDNCFTSGFISFSYRAGDVGGFIGDGGDYVTFTNCYNSADISVRGRQSVLAGGLAGSSCRAINSFNTGSISAYTSGYNTLSTYGLETHSGGIGGYNVYCENCYNEGSISASAAVTCRVSSGGIVGYINYGGSVKNCYNTGRISVTSDYPADKQALFEEDEERYENTFGSGFSAGGIIGVGASGSRTPCSIKNCYNTGTVNAKRCSGGIVGRAGSMTYITNCFNTGNISGSLNVGGLAGNINSNKGNEAMLEQVYNAGAASGGKNTGSLIGLVNGTMKNTNCYYLSGTNATGSGFPFENSKALSAEEMKRMASYEGFDFMDIWQLRESEGMLVPTLRFHAIKED